MFATPVYEIVLIPELVVTLMLDPAWMRVVIPVTPEASAPASVKFDPSP